MLSPEQMKSLKQKNVSVDAEKTKLRFKEDFTSASRADKNTIAELTGQNKNSIYRVYNTGSLGARLVLAISSVLNVTPFYYTGEHDEKEPFQDTLMLSFLKKHGYKKLLDELKGKKPRTPRPKKNLETSGSEPPAADVIEPDKNNDAIVSECEKKDSVICVQMKLSDTEDMINSIEGLAEEDAVLLLKSLFYRSKAGGQAKELADLVKRCLLT